MPARRPALRLLFSTSALLSASGCGADPGQTDDPAAGVDLGEVSLALTTVPTGVQCLRVVATGSQSISQDFPLTAGSGTSLSLGRLPLGSTSLTATAFDVACTATSGVPGSWVSDPLSMTIQSGVVATVTLTLRKNNPVAASVNFVGNITQLSAGNAATFFVMSDGTVRDYGYYFGIASLTNVAEVAGGNGFVCARKTDGTVWCAGNNASGQLGNGSTVGFSGNAVQVSSITGALHLALGGAHACATTANGVYCWGDNTYGQLGNGTTTSSNVPVKIPNVFSYDTLTAGFQHTCATRASSVFCWGSNSYGQLGDGTTTQRSSPTYVAIQPFVSLAAGYFFTCGARADGTVRCWGDNSVGELGDGTFTQRSAPTAVSVLTDATQVAANSNTACVRRQSGAVSCWGQNTYGSIGDGTTDNRPTPTVVTGVTGAASVAIGGDFVLALTDAQKVWGWGNNQNGQLGDGTTTTRFKPVLMQEQ